MATRSAGPTGSEAELASRLAACLNDSVMRARLAVTSKHMRQVEGPAKAAQLLSGLLQHAPREYLDPRGGLDNSFDFKQDTTLC